MNKYTLTFNQNYLELLYQQSKQTLRLQAYKYCSILLLGVTILRMVQFIQSESLIGILITSSVLIVNIVMYGIIQKLYLKGVQWALIIENTMLMLLQYGNQSDHDRFLLGTNLAFIHALFLIIIEFRFAFPNLILLIGLKLLMYCLCSQKAEIIEILLSILAQFSFSTIQYMSEKGKRNVFLSNNNEKNWHCILPQIITDPFILFTYDTERLNFTLKKVKGVNMFPNYDEYQTIDHNFKKFLRQFSIKFQSFEKYILNQVDKHKKFFECQQLELSALNTHSDIKNVKVTFIELYHLQNNFIIVLENNHGQLTKLYHTKNNLIQLLNQHQQLTMGFLQKQIKLIQLSLENSKDQQYIYKTKLHHLYFLGKYRMSNSFSGQFNEHRFSSFDIKELLCSLLDEFNLAYPKMQNYLDSTQTSFKVILDKEMINDFLIQLLYIMVRNVNQEQKNRLMLYSNESYIYLRIFTYNLESLKIQLQKNALIHQILQKNSPRQNLEVQECSIQIQLYKDTQQFNQLIKFE